VAYTSPPNVLPSRPQNRVFSPISEISKAQESVTSHLENSTQADPQDDFTRAYLSVREGGNHDTLDVAWRSFALASISMIESYMSIYMDVVYPIFPLFHGPTMREKLAERRYLTDRGFFASIMAACALAAARARDGAIGDRKNFDEHSERASEVFFAAASDSIPKDLRKAQCLSYMRACGLLAICSIHYGQIEIMHQYIGTYMTLVAMMKFQDERFWPENLNLVDKEERRRLFWAMYSLDVYTAVVFDCLLHSQESHSNVKYPSEISDEGFHAQGTIESSPSNSHNNWLRGWNFAIDLYRILEHLVKRLRRRKEEHHDRISVTRLLVLNEMPDAQVMDNVLGLYYQLPAQFRNFNQPVTGDRSQDLIGFQAANIQATLQLVRMTLFSTNLGQDVYQKCYVAEQVLTTFHSISPHFMRAISTPLVYHLGSIGRILGSVMEGLLCEQSYQRVRGLLVSMADLLQGLESGLQPTMGASREMRLQIEKIDRYMDAQRQLIPSVGVAQQAQPQQQAFPVADNMPNVIVPQPTSLTQQSMSGLGMGAPIDEFHLPSDLVSGEAWPWPFDFSQDSQVPMSMTCGRM
jgi:hypothetical protein